MHRDHQRWYSHRLNRGMGVAIYGNYGGPILAFPTSMGDEWEHTWARTFSRTDGLTARRMRNQPTADECEISDIRYEDGSSLKKIRQGML